MKIKNKNYKKFNKTSKCVIIIIDQLYHVYKVQNILFSLNYNKTMKLKLREIFIVEIFLFLRRLFLILHYY